MPDFDAKSPNMARVYDSLLGGKDNYESDRNAASGLAGISPEIPVVAGENKQFTVRSVEWLANQGITQFLDLGCGMPSDPNTHESAQKISPDARVAYVDIDPVAVNHMRTFARPGSGVAAVEEDVRDPAAVRAALANFIDFTRPVALIMCALLHFYDDDTVRELVAGHTSGLAADSYLAVSVLGTGPGSGEVTERFIQAYSAAVAPVTPYTADKLTGVLGAFELVPPGVVTQDAWRGGWARTPSAYGRDFRGHVAVARVGAPPR